MCVDPSLVSGIRATPTDYLGDPRPPVYNFTGLLQAQTARDSIFRKHLPMGFVDSSIQRHRIVLLLLSGALALLTALLLTLAAQPEAAAAQISPLSPMPVATPLPQSQPQVIATDTPSPLPPPQADSNFSPAAEQSSSADRTLEQAQSEQPLVALGEPTQAQVSLILVGALLLGLGLLVIVVLVVRRRE